ncbi:dihydrolipoamide acetyltransferase family protein [Desulfocastanea catecholica]
MAEFCMPSLGSDMQAGTLIEWRVQQGDRVHRRDVIAVVETDKAAIEIEVYEDGVVESLLVEPGEKVPVGTVMAVIGDKDGVKAAAKERAVPGKIAPVTARSKASPYARKLAAERGVDLNTVVGTGPEGAICAADIEQAAAAGPVKPTEPPESVKSVESAKPAKPVEQPGQTVEPAPQAAPPGKDPQAAMRRAIASAMARSKREIPHYYLQTRIDMHRTLQWLASENAQRPIKERILPVVPLIRAVALALGEVPELNGYWIDDQHRISEAMHIGFVIALRQGGLMAPAILHADALSMDELITALRDLIQRARSGGLRSTEITDATVTITSLGDLGVETVYGIIYPPQVALVGFGKITEQPWAEAGLLGVRPVLTATLAADHRATDGHRGAQFLDALNRYLQEPAKL